MRTSGFSLLEMLVVLAIFIILTGATSPAWINLFHLKRSEQTQEVLHKLVQAVEQYYRDKDGIAPTLDGYLPYWSGNSITDAYGVPLSYAAEVSVNGTACDCVFIASGKNHVLDSVINSTAGTVTILGDDLYQVVQVKGVVTTGYDVTRERLDQADAALAAYYGAVGAYPSSCSFGSTSCVLSLVKAGYLDGKYAYDYWSSILVYRNSSAKFVSSGPDRTFDTSDDLDN